MTAMTRSRFLADAEEKADIAVETASTSLSSVLTNAGTFVKDIFSGFSSGKDVVASSQEKKSPPESKRIRDQLSVVKRVLEDEKRTGFFNRFSAEFDRLAETAEAEWEEREECSFVIKCLKNVTLVPGTLVVDTDATPKSIPTRTVQGGVQPMRACRMKQTLLSTNQAVAKVTADYDSGDDFEPLKNRLPPRKKDSKTVIEIENEEPEAKDQPCPVCEKVFPAKRIQKHVEMCLSSQEKNGLGSDNEGGRIVRTRTKGPSDDGDFLQR